MPELKEAFGRGGQPLNFDKEKHPRGRGGKFSRRLGAELPKAEAAVKKAASQTADPQAVAQAQASAGRRNKEVRAAEHERRQQRRAAHKVVRAQRHAELRTEHSDVGALEAALGELAHGEEHRVAPGVKVKKVGRRTYEVHSRGASKTTTVKGTRWAARTGIEHRDRHNTARAIRQLQPGQTHQVEGSAVTIKKHHGGKIEVSHADAAAAVPEHTSVHESTTEALDAAHKRAILRGDRLAPTRQDFVEQKKAKVSRGAVDAYVTTQETVPGLAERTDKLNPPDARGDIGVEKVVELTKEAGGAVAHPIGTSLTGGAEHATTHGLSFGAEHGGTLHSAVTHAADTAMRHDPGVIGHGHPASDILARAASHVPAEQHHEALRHAATALKHVFYAHGDTIAQHGDKVAHVIHHLIHAMVERDVAGRIGDNSWLVRARAREQHAHKMLVESGNRELVESIQQEFNAYLHPRDRTGEFRGVTSLGVTPFRGKGQAKGNDFYNTTRYKGFENNARRIAETHGATVEKIDRVRGIWAGGGEPSAQVDIKGGAKEINAVMDELGRRYNQDAVLAFRSNPKGKSVRYLSAEPVEANRVTEAMSRVKLPGATILPDGRLEIIDLDDSQVDDVAKVADYLDTDLEYDMGDGELRFKGEHYPAGQARSVPADVLDEGREQGAVRRHPSHADRAAALAEAVAERQAAAAAGDGQAFTRARARELALEEILGQETYAAVNTSPGGGWNRLKFDPNKHARDRLGAFTKMLSSADSGVELAGSGVRVDYGFLGHVTIRDRNGKKIKLRHVTDEQVAKAALKLHDQQVKLHEARTPKPAGLHPAYKPGLHPRNRLGRFRQVIDELPDGAELTLKDGTRVQRQGQMYRVNSTLVKGPEEAIGAIADASARTPHPAAVGGSKVYRDFKDFERHFAGPGEKHFANDAAGEAIGGVLATAVGSLL